MRTGIVTLAHANDNYGGSLQAFALQETLRSLGHDPFFANTALAPRRFSISALFEHPLREMQHARRYSKFEGFWRESFSMDPAGRRPVDAFLASPTPADAYVCGSDQIWSNGLPDNPSRRRFAFLDFQFGGGRRVAYAASWGAPDIPRSVVPDVSRMLAGFAAVGVREKSGVEIARRCGAEARWVADPTLLPGRAFWDAFAGPQRGNPGETLFYGAYRWKTALPAREAVAAVRAAKKLRLVVPAPERPLEFPLSNFTPTPREWVRGIRDAGFVLTNSFHCTVFSAIFAKPFAVLLLGGKYAAMNSRVESLCERLGLSDRLVADRAGLERALAAPAPGAETAERIASWAAESKDFLASALSRP